MENIKNIDKKEVAKLAVVGAGNFVAAGFSIGYHTVDGMAKNKEGNRLKYSSTNPIELFFTLILIVILNLKTSLIFKLSFVNI